MIVFLNGELVPEERATVSVMDRSFLYGDGLFEMMLVHNGLPFCWSDHMERLQRGAEFLKIHLPFMSAALLDFARELVRANRMPEALLRLTLSRGVGVRGYSPKGAERPLVVMTLHPAPGTNPEKATCWKLLTASFRLPAKEALAQFKTCNKLAQVLARAEAEARGADEAVLLNTDGYVVEGASSNLFWIKDSRVCTPPLATGILAGVTRALVVELCAELRIPVLENAATRGELLQAQGVFLSLSTLGVVEAGSLDGNALKASPLTGRIRQAYLQLLNRASA
jgi:branched-chain amino acid aminotransferase